MKPHQKDKRRRGRPTKYCPAVVKMICDAIADGLPFKYAAALGGISHETLCDWQRQYSKFSEVVEKAKARGIYERLKIIRAAARRGNVKAAQWWLERVCPEHFSLRPIVDEVTPPASQGQIVLYLPKKEPLPE
jgi:transposase